MSAPSRQDILAVGLASNHNSTPKSGFPGRRSEEHLQCRGHGYSLRLCCWRLALPQHRRQELRGQQAINRLRQRKPLLPAQARPEAMAARPAALKIRRTPAERPEAARAFRLIKALLLPAERVRQA